MFLQIFYHYLVRRFEYLLPKNSLTLKVCHHVLDYMVDLQ